MDITEYPVVPFPLLIVEATIDSWPQIIKRSFGGHSVPAITALLRDRTGFIRFTGQYDLPEELGTGDEIRVVGAYAIQGYESAGEGEGWVKDVDLSLSQYGFIRKIKDRSGRNLEDVIQCQRCMKRIEYPKEALYYATEGFFHYTCPAD